jgi:hypothetical protein
MSQSKLDTAINIIGLINAGLPAAAQLVLMLRRTDGTFLILDSAEAQFEANLAQAQAWLEEYSQGGTT